MVGCIERKLCDCQVKVKGGQLDARSRTRNRKFTEMAGGETRRFPQLEGWESVLVRFVAAETRFEEEAARSAEER